MNNLKFIEITNESKTTNCVLSIYEELNKIDKEVDKCIASYFDDNYKNCPPNAGIRSIIISNACDNIEYMFSIIHWLINLYENNGYDVNDVKKHAINQANLYREDWRNMFKLKTPNWNWYENRYLTEEELQLQKEKDKELNEIAKKVIEEILKETKNDS